MVALPLLLALQGSPIALDPQATRGVWEGWGTSLCWMGKVFGDRDDLADLFFTTKTVKVGEETLPGLGMNIVRYNAGACSWNEVDGRKMIVSKIILPYRQMEGFWLDPKSDDPRSAAWNWSVDANQRAMMQKAKRRGANRFELFSNAPMWWMCANDNPSGAADPTHDNLRKDCYDAFARYLAVVAKEAKSRWGIRFTTVDPFNEPLSRWWDANCKQEGCHFSIAAQRDLLPRLRRELDRCGLKDLPIAASDETSITHAIQAWNGYDEGTKALVRQVNVHGYEGEESPLKALRTAVGNRPVWLSEHGENDASGLTLARSLNRDLHDLQPRAWCYWQPLDGGGWGFLDADMPKARIRRANPKHFIMAHYARHIRPGMTILETGDRDTVAAYDPKRRKLVLVAYQGDGEATKSFDLSRFSVAKRPVVRWTTEPKAQARYQRTEVAPSRDGRLETTLPPNSVQTFEIDATIRR